MKKLSKLFAGAATAAVLSVSLAAPANAQFYDRYRYRDRGVDAGDIITGVAILGGVAAIASALDRDGSRYGYGNRYRYRDTYRDAVNACGYEAERYGRGGRVQITDVDRRGNGYRVRGIIGGYGTYGGYDRYDRYNRYDRFDERRSFTCWTDYYGRVRDFDVNRYRW
jgi:hypothetical protein